MKKGLITDRLHLILQGLELILDGFLGPHEETRNIRYSSDHQKLLWDTVIRLWHPSYWIGWVRCIVLKNGYGSDIYNKPKRTKNSGGDKDGKEDDWERGGFWNGGSNVCNDSDRETT